MQFGCFKKYRLLSCSFFVLGAIFENVFFLKGWQNNSPNCKKNKMLGSYRFPMFLSISTCKFDAKNTPDAFKHVPDLF